MNGYRHRLKKQRRSFLGEFRKKLQAAYEKEDYEKAKAALMAIKKELRLIKESAASGQKDGIRLL
jgi:hypothetical protein